MGLAAQAGMGKTEGGSTCCRFAISDFVLQLKTVVGQNTLVPVIGGANTKKIGPTMFNAVDKALKNLYDRARLVGLTFHFVPAAALTSPGVLVMYIDYRSDNAVTSYDQAIRTQGAVEFNPYQRGAHLVWRPQGPSDYEYVPSSGDAFNLDTFQTFCIYGENLLPETLLGYIHVSAIVEMTGRQNAA
jgi:hypothetical protein